MIVYIALTLITIVMIVCNAYTDAAPHFNQEDDSGYGILAFVFIVMWLAFSIVLSHHYGYLAWK